MRFIKQIVFPQIILLFLSCGRNHPNETKLNSDYLDKEIVTREGVLRQDTFLAREVQAIKKEVDQLKYLTIDVENMSASINKNNAYFSAAAKYYNVDSSGFVLLYKGVPLYDVINIIKKNHLNLLNKIILKENKNGRFMLTAQ